MERGRDGHVEILTLNRPEQRNALSPALLEGLSAALADIKRDAGLRAVVLTVALELAHGGADARQGAPASPNAVRRGGKDANSRDRAHHSRLSNLQ